MSLPLLWHAHFPLQTISQPSINPFHKILPHLVNKLVSKELHFGNPLSELMCYPVLTEESIDGARHAVCVFQNRNRVSQLNNEIRFTAKLAAHPPRKSPSLPHNAQSALKMRC